MTDMLLQLAQTAAPEKASMATRIIWVTLIAVPPLVIAGMVLVFLRKKSLEAKNEREATGSLMEQLRAMHQRGEISDAEYEQTRKSMASRLSQVMDTKKGGGLFELPEPKRRVSRREMGPVAPVPERAAGDLGRAEGPPPVPRNADDPRSHALPPGYGAEGGSAKPQEPSP